MKLSNERVIFHFDLENPVEVRELTAALNGIANEYKEEIRILDIEKNRLIDDDYNLYITSIRDNCITCELAAYVTGIAIPAMGVISHANTLYNFTKNMANTIRYFATNPDAITAEEGPPLKQTENIAAITKLAAGYDHKGNMRISAVTKSVEGEETVINIDIDNRETVAAAKIADQRLTHLKSKQQHIHNKMFMEITQFNSQKTVTKDGGSRSADKGIIQDFSTKPLPVYWVSEIDAKRIKFQSDNPTKGRGYIVDVNVSVNTRGIPVAYRILCLHDIIDIDTNDGDMQNNLPFDTQPQN